MGIEIQILALVGAVAIYWLLGKMDSIKKYVNDLTDEVDSSNTGEGAGE
jgi:hypothetical protein